MYNFDAPIPGESLTKMPSSMPMEMPAQFSDPEQALNYFWDKLTIPKKATQLILLLKKGAPVESVVNTVLFEAIAQGVVTVDLALNLYQIVYWQVETIAKSKGIKYKTKNPDPVYDEFLAQFVDLLKEPDEQEAKKTSIFKGLM